MLSLLGLLPLAAGVLAASSANCTNSLHMIVARASDEPPGEGITSIVVGYIAAQIPNANSIPVVYPATLSNYTGSESEGVTAIKTLIQDYVSACPNDKYALLGYSQGAQVVLDALCGQTEAGFESIASVSSSDTKNLVAVIQFGDPSFVVGLPYDQGTSKMNGTFPRQNTAACLPYASKIQSYCNANDLFCASGGSLLVHESYIQNSGHQAASFVVKQYNAAVGNSSSSSASASGTSSASATTSATTGSAAGGVGATTITGTASASTSVSPASVTAASSSTSTGAAHKGQVGAPGWFVAGLIALMV